MVQGILCSSHRRLLHHRHPGPRFLRHLCFFSARPHQQTRSCYSSWFSCLMRWWCHHSSRQISSSHCPTSFHGLSSMARGGFPCRPPHWPLHRWQSCPLLPPRRQSGNGHLVHAVFAWRGCVSIHGGKAFVLWTSV